MGKHHYEGGSLFGRHEAAGKDAVSVAELLERAIQEGRRVRYDWGEQDPRGLVQDEEDTAPLERPDIQIWFDEE
jgi:hypothetical protein